MKNLKEMDVRPEKDKWVCVCICVSGYVVYVVTTSSHRPLLKLWKVSLLFNRPLVS